MSERIPFAELAIEAELHALGLEDLAERGTTITPKRSDEQIQRWGVRAKRARAAADILKRLEPHADAFRQFLTSLSR